MPDRPIVTARVWLAGLALGLGLLLPPLAAAAAVAAPISEPVQPGLTYLNGVSCVASRCVAVGGTSGPAASAGVAVSSDGGGSWTLASVPHGLAALYGVSCATALRCVSVGELAGEGHVAGAVASADGGLTWVSESLPAGVPTATSIACVASSCIATGLRIGSVIVTHDGGTRWSLRPLLPPCRSGFCSGGTAGAVTLSNATDGFAAGGDQCGGHVSQCPGNIWHTNDGGNHWKMVFNGFPFVDAISCIDASHCWAAAATFRTGVMLGSANGGRSWRRQTLPPFHGYFNGISCRLVRRHHRCVAVGQNASGTAPVIASTGDGGSHWKLLASPSGAGPLGGVSLASGGHAEVVGETAGATSALAFGL